MKFNLSNDRVLRWGFKSKNQLPLFMIWIEELDDGCVNYAWVKFNSMDWIGF